jgi:hypothetical protein
VFETRIVLPIQPSFTFLSSRNAHQDRLRIDDQDGAIAVLHQGASNMDTALRIFIKEFAGVVAIAFMSVVVVAFVSIPANLGRHPGAARSANLPAGWHLT